MSRPVTIHSDGTGRGTVVLSEDGEQLGGIVDLTVSIAANGVAEATIEVQHASLNMKADVVTVLYTCPCCGDMMEHQCDPVIGNIQAAAMCNDRLVRRDPFSEHFCIRLKDHADSHFDGKIAW